MLEVVTFITVKLIGNSLVTSPLLWFTTKLCELSAFSLENKEEPKLSGARVLGLYGLFNAIFFTTGCDRAAVKAELWDHRN